MKNSKRSLKRKKTFSLAVMLLTRVGLRERLFTVLPNVLFIIFPQQVHIKVSVPKGIKFIGHPGKHHLTRKKCVAPGEATPTTIVLAFTELGPANITGIHRACHLFHFTSSSDRWTVNCFPTPKHLSWSAASTMSIR